MSGRTTRRARRVVPRWRAKPPRRSHLPSCRAFGHDTRFVPAPGATCRPGPGPRRSNPRSYSSTAAHSVTALRAMVAPSGFSRSPRRRGGPRLRGCERQLSLCRRGPFSRPVQDVEMAIRWLRIHATDYGWTRPDSWRGDLQRVGRSPPSSARAAVSRHWSAGSVQNQRPAAIGCVQGVIDWYGLIDLESNPAELGKAGLPGIHAAERRLPGMRGRQMSAGLARSASPLAYIASSDPPFLIQHGAADVPSHRSNRSGCMLLCTPPACRQSSSCILMLHTGCEAPEGGPDDAINHRPWIRCLNSRPQLPGSAARRFTVHRGELLAVGFQRFPLGRLPILALLFLADPLAYGMEQCRQRLSVECRGRSRWDCLRAACAAPAS